ncbi:hypothetical protein PHISP_01192 [Aspergillus sp. HF37]|nr:hypothetical protein PHISP_01192 [Aspergillus sp. HF37]
MFTNLDLNTFTRDFEDPIRGIISHTIDSYHPVQEALMIKMKTGAHEAAHGAVDNLLFDKLAEMNHANRGLVKIGQKTVSSSSRVKKADVSYRPMQLPQGRSKQ